MRRAFQLVIIAAFTPAAILAQTTEARRADLTVFRQQFLSADHSYSEAARAEAEQRVARLESSAGTVSQVYFELELARIVALADNGHTQSFPGPRAGRYNRVAIRLVPFGEDFHVLRTRDTDQDLLGARLVAIDGKPIALVGDVARSLTGGADGWRDRVAAYFLESPELMHALDVTTRANGATYRFALANGRTVERRLAGLAPNASGARVGSQRYMYPDSQGLAGWRPLLAPDRAPWSLQELGTPFRWRDAPELDAIVVELRQNRSTREVPIDPFLRAVSDTIRQRRPRHLVLDMRMNGGGDLNTTRDFMKSLPTLVSGRLFVLTSPWTFSAAISSVGYLEQIAPDRVTIVGEPVGDRLEFWAEGGAFELPNSHVVLLAATQRHDYRNGCRNYRDCHGAVVRNPIAVPTLAPDISAPWTIESYRAGRDPGMEAIAAALRATP